MRELAVARQQPVATFRLRGKLLAALLAGALDAHICLLIAASSGCVLRQFGQVTFAPSSHRSPGCWSAKCIGRKASFFKGGNINGRGAHTRDTTWRDRRGFAGFRVYYRCASTAPDAGIFPPASRIKRCTASTAASSAAAISASAGSSNSAAFQPWSRSQATAPSLRNAVQVSRQPV